MTRLHRCCPHCHCVTVMIMCLCPTLPLHLTQLESCIMDCAISASCLSTTHSHPPPQLLEFLPVSLSEHPLRMFTPWCLITLHHIHTGTIFTRLISVSGSFSSVCPLPLLMRVLSLFLQEMIIDKVNGQPVPRYLIYDIIKFNVSSSGHLRISCPFFDL